MQMLYFIFNNVAIDAFDLFLVWLSSLIIKWINRKHFFLTETRQKAFSIQCLNSLIALEK